MANVVVSNLRRLRNDPGSANLEELSSRLQEITLCSLGPTDHCMKQQLFCPYVFFCAVCFGTEASWFQLELQTTCGEWEPACFPAVRNQTTNTIKYTYHIISYK